MRTQRARTMSAKARNCNAARPSACIKAVNKTKRTAKVDTNWGVRHTFLGLINVMMILGSMNLGIEAHVADDGYYYPVWGEGSDGFCENDPSRLPRFETAGECCNHMFGQGMFASGKKAECTMKSTATPLPQDGVPTAKLNSTSKLPVNLALKLPACNMTTAELMKVGKNPVDPCILYDTQPQISDFEADRTTVVTVVGVFDSTGCGHHRDGAVVAVEKLNQDNVGRGATIGYNKDHFVKFRLIVAIAGNSKQQKPPDYKDSHEQVLEDLILSTSPQYILGSCSFFARYDKDIAGRHRIMVLSQVGPQIFYEENSNDHVFGAHIPSDLYGVPALRALEFAHKEPEERASQKIRIIHRDRSEFFKYTCQAIYDKAIEEGFTDTVDIEYNPEGDENGDEVLNQDDEDFLKGLADQACGREERMDGVAIWVCVQRDFEIDVIVDRLIENGCRPSSFWATKAAIGWAKKRIEAVPYIQAGSQWHQTMDYSDDYFESGQAMLDHLEENFGYLPNYSALGSYHAIYIMYRNIWSFFKTKDFPEVESTFRNSYEDLRRNMLDLSIPESLYGPTIFDSKRRNVGRGSASSQWLFPAGSSSDQAQLILISPDSQATSAVVYPAPSSMACDPGSFVNDTLASAGPAPLESKCSECPADSYEPSSNFDESCRACRAGSGTALETGAVICDQENENPIAPGVVIFGYLIVGMNIFLAVAFATWTVRFRNDPVVTIGQKEFLLLLCAGAALSSSSIIPLSLQAGISEDTTSASRACGIAPWLYATGVTLLYSALFAKSFRMYQVVDSSQGMRRMTVTVRSTLLFVFAALLSMWLILILWTVVDPLHWERFELVDLIDESAGVITHESIGRCTSDYFALWIGMIFLHHFMIVIATNVMLWRLRFVADRYQESKYVTLACLFAVEFLLLGIPILTAIGDDSSLRHITLIFIIALSDMIILLMIFIPKIVFQRKGLPENTTVVGSIRRVTTRRASDTTQATPQQTDGVHHSAESTMTVASIRRSTLMRKASDITLPSIPQKIDGNSNHDNELGGHAGRPRQGGGPGGHAGRPGGAEQVEEGPRPEPSEDIGAKEAEEGPKPEPSEDVGAEEEGLEGEMRGGERPRVAGDVSDDLNESGNDENFSHFLELISSK